MKGIFGLHWWWRQTGPESRESWTRSRCSPLAQRRRVSFHRQTSERPAESRPNCWAGRRTGPVGMQPRRWWWNQTVALKNRRHMVCYVNEAYACVHYTMVLSLLNMNLEFGIFSQLRLAFLMCMKCTSLVVLIITLYFWPLCWNKPLHLWFHLCTRKILNLYDQSSWTRAKYKAVGHRDPKSEPPTCNKAQKLHARSPSAKEGGTWVVHFVGGT